MKSIMKMRIRESYGCRKHLKGFTLIEVIVVLVIIAVLAAIALPALTGYIDKANQKKLISETHTAVTAIQTWATMKYGDGQIGDEGLVDTLGNPIVQALAPLGTPDAFLTSTPASMKYELYVTYMFEDPGNKGAYIGLPDYGNGIAYSYKFSLAGSNTYETPRYTQIALGGGGWNTFTPKALPADYAPSAELAKLISDGTSLPSDSKPDSGGMTYIYEVILYYDYTGSADGGETGDDPDTSTWRKIVDELAHTKWESEDKFFITDVRFNDMNMVTHLILSNEKGQFVAYYNGRYTFNLDPAVTI
jgi:type IV pilus assembly protein PilA